MAIDTDTVTSADRVWYLYIIRCGDNSLYTGITTDVARRLHEHQAVAGDNGGGPARGKGAKALRGKRPLSLVFQATVGDRSRALKLEYRVKQLSKTDKEALVNNTLTLDTLITSGP